MNRRATEKDQRFQAHNNMHFFGVVVEYDTHVGHDKWSLVTLPKDFADRAAFFSESEMQ